MQLRISYVNFQIKMSQDENSISLLEAGNLGSQEQAKEFPCGYCNKIFVHEKRLMTHVKAKHSKEVAEEPKAAPAKAASCWPQGGPQSGPAARRGP